MRLFENMRASVVFGLPVLFSAASARAEEGLPQLNTALFPEQIFWLAIAFTTLYVLMSRVALPGVARTKDHRKSTVGAELEAARLANERAKAAAEQVERSLGEARKKAQDIMNAQMVEVAAHAAQQQAQQDKQHTSRLRSAEATIAVAREAALSAVRAGASDLSSAIVDKILGSKGRGSV